MRQKNRINPVSMSVRFRDTVYASLEPEAQRYVTTHAQQFVPDDHPDPSGHPGTASGRHPGGGFINI